MSKQHEMRLDTIYFNYILSGKKIYETRVWDSKRKQIGLMDTVLFKDRGSSRTFTAQITEISWFKDFKLAILDSGLKKVLPNATSVENGVKLYESFPHDEGTFKQGAKKFGVLRMKFNIIKK